LFKEKNGKIFLRKLEDYDVSIYLGRGFGKSIVFAVLSTVFLTEKEKNIIFRK